MTNQQAIEFLKIERDHMTPTIYTEPVEAMDMAISALQAQEARHSTESSSTHKALDTISRQEAIDIASGYAEQLNGYIGTPNDSEVYAYARGLLLSIQRNIDALTSTHPEIIYCKDCRKHNVSSGYKNDCCALYEWRGMSYGHEHDYQHCCFAERRTDAAEGST